MSAEEALKKLRKKWEAEDKAAHDNLVKLIEKGIAEGKESVAAIKKLRSSIFSGPAAEQASRAAILLATQTLINIRTNLGIYSNCSHVFVAGVRRRAQPNTAYLTVVFDRLSQSTIDKVHENNRAARSRLKKIQSNPTKGTPRV